MWESQLVGHHMALGPLGAWPWPELTPAALDHGPPWLALLRQASSPATTGCCQPRNRDEH